MKYKEIFRLMGMLIKEDIPFVLRTLHDGFQLCYPNTEDRACSAIEHKMSYGHNQDKLEIMGLLTDKEAINDDVVGYLTAENVFERICKHYREEIIKRVENQIANAPQYHFD